MDEGTSIAKKFSGRGNIGTREKIVFLMPINTKNLNNDNSMQAGDSKRYGQLNRFKYRSITLKQAAIKSKIIIVLILIGVGSIMLYKHGLATRAHVQNPNGLLIEFENTALWSAVGNGFRARQQGWRAEVNRASSGQEFARLLIEFESWIISSAKSAGWNTRRDAWICEVGSAGAGNSWASLGNLLVELESNVLWSAVDEKYRKGRRTAWIDECRMGTVNSPAYTPYNDGSKYCGEHLPVLAEDALYSGIGYIPVAFVYMTSDECKEKMGGACVVADKCK